MSTVHSSLKPRSAKQGVSYANVASASKKQEQQTETAMAPPGFAELQAALQRAMEEMARFSGTLSTLQADVTSVKTTQGKMKTDVVSIFQRLNEAEGRISELEDENESLRKMTQSSAQDCSELREMMTDMANRERRFNVRVFGLKEQKDSQVKLRERLINFFTDALGVEVAESDLQMVHRVSYEMPSGNKPPRPVIVRFQSYLVKERVLAAARAKARVGEGIQWNDSKMSVFPDMTKEVVDKRKRFTDVRKKLHELNVRFTLAYPAVLRFTWKGDKVSFVDPQKAMELLSGAESAEADDS